MLRRIRHAAEAGAILICYWSLAILPIDVASAIGGLAGRAIGPRIALSDRARRNMRRFMPELGEAGIEAAVVEMWDNLGRLAAEYPHLDDIGTTGDAPRVEMVGKEIVRAAAESGRPVIFFGAHQANWELAAMLAARFGHPVHTVYREANNRYVEMLLRARRGRSVAGLVPKGRKGARLAMEALRKGEWLAMLLDQKMNDGLAVPFFGTDAMTAPAIATLALRYDCVVIGAHLERLGGAHFRVTLTGPIALPHTGDEAADRMTFLRAVNAEIERWVRLRPGQWLWLHRRWPDA